jgi:integrase
VLDLIDMGRPKKYNYPPNMTPDTERGMFIVRNPVTKKRKRFEDESQAREAARLLNEWIHCEQQAKALEAGRPTIGGLVDKWVADKLQFMAWDEGTRTNVLAKMGKIKRELGSRLVSRTDCLFLEEWMLGFCKTGDAFNKWRYALILLWKFAVSRKLADNCEPEKIESITTSKKLEMNRKSRLPIDVDGFKAIHKIAPGWLALAMEQSLVTLQARLEICNMRHADYRDGHLFVIRDKVSGDSDMAFIKIALTPQLEDLRSRALKLDSVASPYLVHRAPERRRRQWTEGKPHWTYINPDYLTKAFAEAREQSRVYAHLKPDERPSFHEIRGLGARLYREQGMPEGDIQALMTHAHKRTTQIYLDGGAKALTDADYQKVVAPMSLRDIGITG